MESKQDDSNDNLMSRQSDDGLRGGRDILFSYYLVVIRLGKFTEMILFF